MHGTARAPSKRVLCRWNLILGYWLKVEIKFEPHSTECWLQLNQCLLQAQFHIWQAKLDELSLDSVHFLDKSR